MHNCTLSNLHVQFRTSSKSVPEEWNQMKDQAWKQMQLGKCTRKHLYPFLIKSTWQSLTYMKFIWSLLAFLDLITSFPVLCFKQTLLSFHSSTSTAFITFLQLYNFICTTLHGKAQAKFILARSKREFKSVSLRKELKEHVSVGQYITQETV